MRIRPGDPAGHRRHARPDQAWASSPTVCHMNEGHSRLPGPRAHPPADGEARPRPSTRPARSSRAGNVFTTHTPVPAGNDHLPPELVRHVLRPLLKADRLGLGMDRLLALGRQNPDDTAETFCMTVLALQAEPATATASASCTARSRASMWQQALAEGCRWTRCRSRTSPTASTPAPGCRNEMARSATTATWAPLDEETHRPQSLWDRVDQIPDEELWRTHERRRERLVGLVRRRLRQTAEQARGHAARRSQQRRRGPRSRGPDDRLRPALRHLQARPPCCCGTWSG